MINVLSSVFKGLMLEPYGFCVIFCSFVSCLFQKGFGDIETLLLFYLFVSFFFSVGLFAFFFPSVFFLVLFL